MGGGGGVGGGRLDGVVRVVVGWVGVWVHGVLVGDVVGGGGRVGGVLSG